MLEVGRAGGSYPRLGAGSPPPAGLSLLQRDYCIPGAEQGLFLLSLEQPGLQTLRTHFPKFSGTVGPVSEVLALDAE